MRIEIIKSSTVIKAGQQLVVLRCSKFYGSAAYFHLQQGIGTGVVQYYRHREEPVPWVRRSRNGRSFRYQKTANERRSYFSDEATRELLESYGVVLKLRQKRSSQMLPTSWDDLSRLHQRTWKEHRKARHKNADNIDRRVHSPAFWDW